MKLTKLSNGTYINPAILAGIRLIGANEPDAQATINGAEQKKIVIYTNHSEISIGPVNADQAQGLIDELVELSRSVSEE